MELSEIKVYIKKPSSIRFIYGNHYICLYISQAVIQLKNFLANHHLIGNIIVLLIAALFLGQPFVEVCLNTEYDVSILETDIDGSSDLEEYTDTELENEKTITDLSFFESKNAAFVQVHLVHFIPYLWSDCSQEILIPPPEITS